MFLTHILSVCVPESVRDFFYTNCHKVEYQFVCTIWMNAALSVVNKIMLYNSNNTHRPLSKSAKSTQTTH